MFYWIDSHLDTFSHFASFTCLPLIYSFELVLSATFSSLEKWAMKKIFCSATSFGQFRHICKILSLKWWMQWTNNHWLLQLYYWIIRFSWRGWLLVYVQNHNVAIIVGRQNLKFLKFPILFKFFIVFNIKFVKSKSYMKIICKFHHVFFITYFTDS